MIKSNYHTHIYRCQHASGDIEDLCQEAIKKGMHILGISDHMPFPKGYNDWQRMDIDDIDDYISDFEIAKSKYGNKLELYIGAECEYLPDLDEHCAYLKSKLDYLVFGAHLFLDGDKVKNAYSVNDFEELECYVDTVIMGIKTGYFSAVTHPDVVYYNYTNYGEKEKILFQKLIDTAILYDVALELNANGFRREKKVYNGVERYQYPFMPFWEQVAKTKAKVIIGSDCHNPNQLWDEKLPYAYEIADKLGLNVVYKLNLK